MSTMKRAAILTAAGIGAGVAAASVGAGLAAYALVNRTRRAADLRGQVVLITGGSRGLGLQLAREFAKAGCRVAICARDVSELERARHDLQARGADVWTHACDVSDREQVEETVREATAHFGRIDIVVANAGIIGVGPVEHMRVEDFQHAMDVMFWGAFHPIWAALPQMIERGSGRIVTITSIGGKVSVPHLIPYSCAKFAAVALSEGLRTELSPKGIQVLTIVPGLMRTGSYLNALFKGQHAREFAWFGLSSSMPGLTISVDRAARQIVSGVRRGRAERILTMPAQILARFHGAFPELSGAILTLAGRMLPGAQGGSEQIVKGHEAEQQLNSRLFRAATTLGRASAERQHEMVP